MKTCHYEGKIEALSNGGLSAKEAALVEDHLVTCDTCFARWESLTPLVSMLSGSDRPEPPPGLLADYQRELNAGLAGLPEKPGLWWRIRQGFESLLQPAGIGWRIAQAAVVLIVGIFLGRQLLQSDLPEAGPPLPAALQQNISYDEVESVQRFFNEAEVLMIQVMNLGEPGAIEPAEVAFTRELAGEMIIRCHIMQEKAIDLDDMAMLKLLHRMDVLLYEIANLDDADLPDTLPFIQRMVRDMNGYC